MNVNEIWIEKLEKLLGRKLPLAGWFVDQCSKGFTPEEVAESVVFVRVA